MSLDIYLTDSNGGEIIALNWLRNSFGLCQFVEDNVSVDSEKSLFDVCNNSGNSKEDRESFLTVVLAYKKELDKLEEGYYYFKLNSYIKFVQPNFDSFETENFYGTMRIKDASIVYQEKTQSFKIPMWQFNNKCFHLGGNNTLEYYKKWFADLVTLAYEFQNESTELSISN